VVSGVGGEVAWEAGVLRGVWGDFAGLRDIEMMIEKRNNIHECIWRLPRNYMTLFLALACKHHGGKG